MADINEFKKFVKFSCLKIWPTVFPNDRILDYALDNFDVSEEDATRWIEESRIELLEEQESWPEVTDCDRLDRAAATLERMNILFVQHIDTTPSSCWAEIRDIIRQTDNGNRFIGAAYYHFQSTERALEYGMMHINFGTTDAGDAVGASVVSIRQAVVEALMEEGLQIPEFLSTVSYILGPSGSLVLRDPVKNRDGDKDTAIEINPIVWQKRF